jgi:hypothetical protein
MKMNEYRGKTLVLQYPSFLKVKSPEPVWSALSAGGTSSAIVCICPPPATAEAFSRLIRNPNFTRVPDATIIREGSIITANGINGYERLSKVRDTIGWMIDGKTVNDTPINIQLWASPGDWQDGTMWEQFIDSIAVADTQGCD